MLLDKLKNKEIFIFKEQYPLDEIMVNLGIESYEDLLEEVAEENPILRAIDVDTFSTLLHEVDFNMGVSLFISNEYGYDLGTAEVKGIDVHYMAKSEIEHQQVVRIITHGVEEAHDDLHMARNNIEDLKRLGLDKDLLSI